MDTSTDGVTLASGLVFELLEGYRDLGRVCAPAFHLVRGLDPKRPEQPCPVVVFNQLCDWIEANLGGASARAAGRVLGTRAFTELARNSSPDLTTTPLRMLAALQAGTDALLRDPRGRGWELLETGDKRAVVRRTQPLHCVLLEGLLAALVERTEALLPRVEQLRCTRRGAPYCDYEVLWTRPTARLRTVPTRR